MMPWDADVSRRYLRQSWQRLRIWSALLTACVLTACATVQRIDADAVDAFSRTGRFALTVHTPDASPQATQGGFAWHDDGRVLRVNLTNPVGSVLAQLRVEPGRALLVRSNGAQEQAQNPDTLATLVLGRTVPVSSLREWLRGRISPQATDVTRDDAGHVLRFTQDGWHAQSSRFDAQGPRLLRLSRSDAGGQQVLLRLVIDGQ